MNFAPIDQSPTEPKKASSEVPKLKSYTSPHCGYCTKLKADVYNQNMSEQFEFVDCSKEACPADLRGYPHTCNPQTGKCVTGYAAPEKIAKRLA
jgi:hypothetical protein